MVKDWMISPSNVENKTWTPMLINFLPLDKLVKVARPAKEIKRYTLERKKERNRIIFTFK